MTVALLWRRRKNALPPLSEAEAYARCHGGRSDDVRIVKIEPRRLHYDLDTSGESLRKAFEQRLDSREPEEEEDESRKESDEPGKESDEPMAES